MSTTTFETPPFTLSEQVENAFRESKRTLADATMLAHPVPGELVSLVIDASDYVIGAVLQQRVNNTWQPLGFVTNFPTPYITKYSAYDRKLLAVKGRNYVIFTDHKSFTYAFNQHLDKCSPRQFQHVDCIGQFTTDIRYIKGLNNNVADALHRIETIGKSINRRILAVT